MATYLRPTSPDVYAPILYNAPIDQLARVAETKQAIYKGNVDALRSQVNDFLGLEQNAFYDFNKPRIAEFNKKAAEQMNKISSADFSLTENQIAASNIFKPLLSDPYVQKDQMMAAQEAKGRQTFQEYQAIDNKSRKEGKASNLFSNGNFEHWQRSVNRAKKAAPDEIDIYGINQPTSYIDVTGKLLKLAKDQNIKVVSTGPSADGQFVQTVTNGRQAITPIRQFFAASLNSEDFNQLNIDSDNQKYSAVSTHIMEQRAIGRNLSEDTAEKELGTQVYQQALPWFTQQKALNEKQYNSLKSEADKYDPNGQHTDLEAQTYQNKMDLMNYHKQQMDNYDEFINNTPDKSLAGWQYFKEKYKNKVVDDLASTYANATVETKQEVNQFALAKYKAQLDYISDQQKFRNDLALAELKKTKEGKDKEGKTPSYSPIGAETVLNTEEIGNTYDLHIDQKKVLLNQIVNDTNKFFDVQHNTRLFEKLNKLPDVDGKGNAIRIGQTGITPSEIRVLNEILQKQGISGNTGNNSISFVKKQMEQYQSEEMNRLLKDPGAEVGTNVELQTYLGRITEYQSKVGEMNAAERTAWEESLTNKVAFDNTFNTLIKDRSGDKGKFEVTDLFDKDGALIGKSDFINLGLKQDQDTALKISGDAIKELEQIKQQATQAGDVAKARAAGDQQAIIRLQMADKNKQIQDKWGTLYDKNVGKARQALNKWTTDHFENNGWKPQAFTIDNEAEQKLVATRAINALEGNSEAFWRGDFSNSVELQNTIGALNNLLTGTEKGVAVVTTAELGGNKNYVTIRFDQTALNKLNNKETKLIPADLFQEISTKGLRVKDVETPLSAGGKERTIYDLQIQAGTPVSFDLSYDPSNPMKAGITYKRNLNGPGGKYNLQVETLVPDVDPLSGEIRLNEKGGAKFKAPSSQDFVKKEFPIDTGAANDVGSVEYILPAMRDIITARRVFYAWANSGQWRKSNPNIKTLADLQNLFTQQYQGINPWFENPATVQPQTTDPFSTIK